LVAADVGSSSDRNSLTKVSLLQFALAILLAIYAMTSSLTVSTFEKSSTYCIKKKEKNSKRAIHIFLLAPNSTFKRKKCESGQSV